MYSSESIRISAMITNFGFKLKCVPGYLAINGHSAKFIKPARTELDLRKSVCASFVLLQGVFLTLGLYYELFYNPKQSERAQFYLVAAFMLTAMAFQFVTIIFFDQNVKLVNTFLTFGQVLHRFHKPGPSYKDGVESFLKLWVCNAIGVSALAIPCAYLAIVEETHFAKLLNVCELAPVIFSIIFGAIVVVDWVQVSVYIASVLLYTNTTLNSLRLMKYVREDEEMIQKLNQTVINIYRGHQVFNNLAMLYCRQLVLIVVGLSSFVMISMAYAAIGFYKQLELPLTIGIISTCITTFVIAGICFNFSTNITEASKEFSASYLRNDVHMSKDDRLSLQASRPLYVEIGNIDKIKETTFLNLMSNVVVENIINLLLI